MALFETWSVGTCAMRNRIVRSATAESLADGRGRPTPRLQRIYEVLAEGGAGLIVTGYAYVCEDGKPTPGALGVADGGGEGAYRKLVEAVHGRGARIALQLVYGGSKGKVSEGTRCLGPSAVRNPKTGVVPAEATPADLDRLADAFAAAAARAERYGFDAVEVHAAHGYLLSQFLSPRFNRREDDFGGSLENRARLACRCVEAVRGATQAGFPVLVKLNSCDDAADPAGEGGGLGEPESAQAAQLLVAAGASCIDVTGDWHTASARSEGGNGAGPYFAEYGKRLAREVDVPVVVTGGWRDCASAERAVGEGLAAVGMCRPLVCEPGLPRRWQAGDAAPSPCTACGQCAKAPGIPCALAGRG